MDRILEADGVQRFERQGCGVEQPGRQNHPYARIASDLAEGIDDTADCQALGVGEIVEDFAVAVAGQAVERKQERVGKVRHVPRTLDGVCAPNEHKVAAAQRVGEEREISVVAVAEDHCRTTDHQPPVRCSSQPLPV